MQAKWNPLDSVDLIKNVRLCKCFLWLFYSFRAGNGDRKEILNFLELYAPWLILLVKKSKCNELFYNFFIVALIFAGKTGKTNFLVLKFLFIARVVRPLILNKFYQFKKKELNNFLSIF